MVQLRNKDGGNLVAATQNNGPLKMFATRQTNTSISFKPGDVSVLLTYKNGKKQRENYITGTPFFPSHRGS